MRPGPATEEAPQEVIPELALALAVVETALHDLGQPARLRARLHDQSTLDRAMREYMDARAFLLVRLNEEGNVWGNILRLYGYIPLTPGRLAHVKRTKGD